MSASYYQPLDYGLGCGLWVEFTTERGEVTNYAVILLFAVPGGMETVRVYDSAHGRNEMHRFTRERGKQTGTLFHSGTLAEGLQAAIDEAKRGCTAMIEGWKIDG